MQALNPIITTLLNFTESVCWKTQFCKSALCVVTKGRETKFKKLTLKEFANVSCRSFLGLALAGDLLLHPAHAAHGLYVLYAGDAALPAVEGQEARGWGGPALLARTRRAHRVRMRPHWRRLWWNGECLTNKQGLRGWNAVVLYRLPACLLPGLQFPAVWLDGPRRLQAPGDWRHADGVSADDGNQRHHVLRWEHFRTGSFQGAGVLQLTLSHKLGYIHLEGAAVNALLFFQESDLASVIVGAIQVVFTAVAALIMDKAGRKVLLIISGTSSQHENKVQSFQQMRMQPFWSFPFLSFNEDY